MKKGFSTVELLVVMAIMTTFAVGYYKMIFEQKEQVEQEFQGIMQQYQEVFDLIDEMQQGSQQNEQETILEEDN